MTTRERYEHLAARWDAEGRPPALLASGYRLIALRCWSYSDGAKADGCSDLLQALIHASEQAQPKDWIDAYFSDRESCSACGESYRFENIALCTQCSRKYCYRCKGGQPRAANGNPACACGDGELVG